MAKHVISDVDVQIKGYQGKFKELKSAFLDHGSLVTQITVLQTKFLGTDILDQVNHIGEHYLKILLFFHNTDGK
jgi:hypothetical protein